MNKRKKLVTLVCPLCGREMELWSIRYLFKDCYDKTHICEHCNLAAIYEVRFGVPNMVLYRDINDPEKNARVHVLR